MEYDVAIIGAGLAGLSAAYRLLEDSEKNVLILEKNDTVKKKICGGLICGSIFDNFNFGLRKEKILIDNCKAYFSGFDSIEFGFYPPLYSINRSLLDNKLYQSVLKRGAKILFGRHVVEEKIETDNIYLADFLGREYKSKFLIDASGSASFTQAVYGWPRKKFGVCKQAVLSLENFPWHWGNSFVVFFNSKIFNHGYGWLIPKKEEIYVGLGVYSDFMKHGIDGYYNVFMNFLQKKFGMEISKPKKIERGVVPLTINSRTYTNKVLVVGDAAGFVDPFWGGGCRYAVKSGFIAAEIIKKILNNKIQKDSLHVYEDLWKHEFSDTLKKSRKISKNYGNDKELRKSLIDYLEKENG